MFRRAAYHFFNILPVTGLLLGLAVGFGLCFFLGSAKAQTEGGAEVQAIEENHATAQNNTSLWINMGGFSKHFEDNGRNEVNLGLGAEYRFRSDMSVMAGYHKNSLDLRTRYVALNYQPLEMGPFRIGASIGVMDGYPLKNRGRSFFAILPMATYEGERFGVNFGVIPNIPSQHVEGAFVLQLKFKLK